MKSILFIILFILITIKTFPQNYRYGGFVSATTHKIIIPEDGSLDEALRLSSEWGEKILKKNSKIIDVKYLLSAAESDTMDL